MSVYYSPHTNCTLFGSTESSGLVLLTTEVSTFGFEKNHLLAKAGIIIIIFLMGPRERSQARSQKVSGEDKFEVDRL